MIMFLIIHIIFAVIAIPLMLVAILIKYLGSDKAQTLVKLSSYSLIGLLSTGTLLVVLFHAGLVSSCYAGLTYSVIFLATYLGYRKMTESKAKIK